MLHFNKFCFLKAVDMPHFSAVLLHSSRISSYVELLTFEALTIWGPWTEHWILVLLWDPSRCERLLNAEEFCWRSEALFTAIYFFFWLFALGLGPINSNILSPGGISFVIVSPSWMSQKWKMCLVSERGQTWAWKFITCTATRWRQPIHQPELAPRSQTFPIKRLPLSLWKREVHSLVPGCLQKRSPRKHNSLLV